MLLLDVRNLENTIEYVINEIIEQLDTIFKDAAKIANISGGAKIKKKIILILNLCLQKSFKRLTQRTIIVNFIVIESVHKMQIKNMKKLMRYV